MTEHVYVVVRYVTNTYQAAAGGQRASSTAGPSFAAQRLGEKLFGERFDRATQLPPALGDDHNVTRWQLLAGSAGR